MFKKVLIANRGEIALRVIRTCREMGIATVAVHSTADAGGLHVRFADEAICVGPPAAAQSYLNIPAILSAANVTGADAIHPGYGFLSENAEFARVCEGCGVRFVGPPADLLRRLGNKVEARSAMRAAGLAVLPGSDEPLRSVVDAEAVCERIGYPVILKAAAGGGGRGMKVAGDRAALRRVFTVASAEAEAAFGSGEMLVERHLARPRHIEVQILADSQGSAVHLYERECSVQRRHQKLVEEAPSPALDEASRARLCDAAVAAARAVGFVGVGTFEFLCEGGSFWFIEVNPRIQVEHAVTEAITGIDLVREQLRMAAGERLGLEQDDVVRAGYAVECRINAEDPVTFLPSPGLITAYHAPGGLGIRVDAAIYEQYRVETYYDPLLGKLIVHGATREEAIRRMRGALAELVVEGIRTNIAFHRALLAHPEFAAGRYDAGIVDRLDPALVRHELGSDRLLAVAPPRA